MRCHHPINCCATAAVLFTLSINSPVVSGFSLEGSNAQTVGRTSSLSILSSTKSNESDIEKLLRKARELRAEAEASEKEVTIKGLDKKEKDDAEADRLINNIFPSSSVPPYPLDGVVERLRGKRLCMETLTKMTKRLYELECNAKGIEYVKASIRVNKGVEYERVKKNKDDKEANRVSAVISRLIDGVAVLDEEFLEGQKTKGEKYISHFDAQHWNAGNSAETLKNKIRTLRRENDEQLQKRQEEYLESLKNKKDSTDSMNLL
mmetsp:Transcript_1976/g.2395  ORF Transcript_1976/g.2395 Transcript_1976/m.2395 type:complete len:263 (+) Transcript_1976:111-899(+)